MRQRSPAGFTLLEVLIALVVLGLLVVGLAQGMRAQLMLQGAQMRRLGDTAELDSAMRLLRHLLTRLPTGPNRLPLATGAGSEFRGEAGRLTFVGDLPSGLGATRRAAMTLHLRQDRLILSWIPRRHERPLGRSPGFTDTELLRGVVRLELAYWGSDAADRAPGWHGEWEEPELPELIRVRLVFAENDRRRWPDLISSTRP